MSDQVQSKTHIEAVERLQTEIARLQGEVASRDKLIELLKESDGKLSTWLGKSHVALDQLLGWMECARGNIPPELTTLIAETRLNLTRQQGLFLKEFGK
jgi:hypothetical protein